MKVVMTYENRPGRRGAFVGAWLEPQTKRRLAAMSLVRGESLSDVLRGLIDAAPIEAVPTTSNRAGVRQDTPSAAAAS